MRTCGNLPKALAAVVALLLVPAPVPADESGRAAAAAGVLERLMNTTCRVGEQRGFADDLVAYADLLVPQLITILHEGPDADLVAKKRSAYAETWGRQRAFLDVASDLGLTWEDRQILEAVSRDAFVERRLTGFMSLCRERAALGLAVIGSPDTLRALREAAVGADPELREQIEFALAHIAPAREEGRGRRRSSQASGGGSRGAGR